MRWNNISFVCLVFLFIIIAVKPHPQRRDSGGGGGGSYDDVGGYDGGSGDGGSASWSGGGGGRGSKWSGSNGGILGTVGNGLGLSGLLGPVMSIATTIISGVLPMSGFVIETVSIEEMDDACANLYFFFVPFRSIPDTPQGVDHWCNNHVKWEETFDKYIMQRTIEEGNLFLGQIIWYILGQNFKRKNNQLCADNTNRMRFMHLTRESSNFTDIMWSHRKAYSNALMFALDSDTNWEIHALCCGYWEYEKALRANVRSQEVIDFVLGIHNSYHKQFLDWICTGYKEGSDSCRNEFQYPPWKNNEPKFTSLHVAMTEVILHDLSLRTQLIATANRIFRGDANLKLPFPRSVGDILGSITGFGVSVLNIITGGLLGIITGGWNFSSG